MNHNTTQESAANDPRPADARPSGMLQAIFALFSIGGGLPATQIFAAFLFSMYASLSGWSQGQTERAFTTTIGTFAFALLSAVLMAGLIVLLLRLFKWRASTIGLKRPRFIHLVGGVIAALPYYLILILSIAALSAVFPGFDTEQKQDVGFNNVIGPMELVLTFLALVVVAPIIEEIAIRGFLYTGVRAWLSRLASALVVSVVFASLHLLGGEGGSVIWVAAIDTFILSLVLVGLREVTGNLWAGIVLHSTKNLLAFLALYVFSAA